MRKQLLVIGLLSIIVTGNAQQNNSDPEKYAEKITATGLKEKLTVIASAEMEGRETATPGQKKAAAYIETRFKKMGLKPGNGDSYQMLFPVYRDELVSWTFAVNGKQYNWGQDYTLSLNTLSTGEWTQNNTVFAGYGIVDDAKNRNDFAGLDVKGKLVIALDGTDDNNTTAVANNTRARNANPASAFAKINIAKKNGALGLLIVSKGFPHTVHTPTQGGMYLKPNTERFINASISEELASALLGRTSRLSSEQLKQVNKGNYVAEVKITADKHTETMESSNVVAIIPGTDKKDEYLFVTGHYDHLGKRGDVIYYGADDDGSGTTSVLQIAEAFAAAARKGEGPRRTIVFMTVSGEEKGLWGSDYYSEHPIFPLDKTTADLNIDMVGRVDTERKTADTLNYVYVIGHDKLSSELPVINEGVNNKYTKLTLDYKYDDPNDRNFIYYRSDHFNFAKKGVPVLFFYDGMLLADYHQPTDTVDKINFELMEKRAKMIFHTAWVIANKDEMLKRDTPLNMPGR
jgi:hypothetical protein